MFVVQEQKFYSTKMKKNISYQAQHHPAGGELLSGSEEGVHQRGDQGGGAPLHQALGQDPALLLQDPGADLRAIPGA